MKRVQDLLAFIDFCDTLFKKFKKDAL